MLSGFKRWELTRRIPLIVIEAHGSTERGVGRLSGNRRYKKDEICEEDRDSFHSVKNEEIFSQFQSSRLLDAGARMGVAIGPFAVVDVPFEARYHFIVPHAKLPFCSRRGEKMKIALNGATTMHADLETDIRAAGAAGFDLVELWASKLRTYLETHAIADLRALLTENNVEPYSINSIEHITFRTPEDYESIKAQCGELAAIAGQIACPYIVVVPGRLPEGGATKDEIIEESVRVLNELADIAEPYGVSLAFEFLGQTDCSVQTLDLCNEIVEKVDRKSVGNVIDTFHFYAGNSSFEAIDSMRPEKLFIFHINDAEDLPKETLTDAHRLYPGTGILPIAEIKEHFDKIGYDRMVSIEIFRPEYWDEDPFEVAKKAKAATEKVLSLGQYTAGGSW